MLSAFIIIIAVSLYSVVHSLTASNQVKNRFRERFGTETDRWYRLGFNVFAGLSFLPIIWLMAILSDKSLYIIPTPWMLLTTLGQIAGAVIIIVGIGQTDALSFIGIRQIFQQADETGNSGFINTGLYAWVRHPLYTGGLIMIWLAPSMSVNLLTLFIVLTIYLFVGARFEEERFVEELGLEYMHYQKQVPMLIPSLRWKR